MKLTRNKESEAFSIESILDIANIVISRYAARNIIPSREKEDVKMAVVEKFINQKKKIDKAFEGKSKLSTYYIAIMNRMCCEVIRHESKHWYSVNDDKKELYESDPITLNIETEKNTIFHLEEKRLDSIIHSFKDEEGKLILFLKFYFHLTLSRKDFEKYSIDKANELMLILQREETTAKSEIFDKLAEAVNLVEQKNVKGDAVRMWLHKQIETLLSRLNKSGDTEYTRESLEIIIEMHSARLCPAMNTIPVALMILFLITGYGY